MSVANIAKCNLCDYFGREIPNSEQLGLDPNRKYRLLRPAEELAKEATVRSARQLPILDKHVPITAETHTFENTIGSTGSDVRYEHPYLRTSLVFWPQEAIDDIESERTRQLSPAYRYKAVMVPGIWMGEPYDGRMEEILFNHLALVAEGRQGVDIIVGDSIPVAEIISWDMIERALSQLA